MLLLPIRLGGIGISNPIETADNEYSSSFKITENLTRIIFNQERSLDNYDNSITEEAVKGVRKEKEIILKSKYDALMEKLDSKSKRALVLATEKGAGSWLSATPIKSLDFVLNKQEFRDGIFLRYDWSIPNMASYCHCGAKNEINHALCCMKGGFVIRRHNLLRDLEADLLKDICSDVRVEPQLMPLVNESLNGNVSENARLDVSAVGIWGPFEKTFLDVRVVHPNAPSYINKNTNQIYKIHENEKKRSYNERIIQVEKGSFVPLVFSTVGGMGEEASKYHKRIALLISEKKNEKYADVLNFVRTKIRFCLLKSILIAIRGYRGKINRMNRSPISGLSFNLLDINIEH